MQLMQRETVLCGLLSRMVGANSLLRNTSVMLLGLIILYCLI